jgi:Enoyl-CoA hydratase/carnithine racemase
MLHKKLPEFEAIEMIFLPSAAVIKFSRPKEKNPLSLATIREVEQAIDFTEESSEIKTIIFTGSGNTFASGANLKEVAALDETEARGFGLRGQNLMQRIYRLEKLTVAAVDGFCMGGAFDLALSCRRRVASERSVFAHPGASLGIVTGWSGTQLLPRLVGKKRALEIFLTAKRIEARDALEIGLIDEIAENPLEFSIANYA